MFIDQIASYLNNISGAEVLVAVGIGYTILILHIAKFEDFWDEMGGAERGFIAVIVGFLVFLFSRWLVEGIFGSFANKVLTGHPEVYASNLLVPIIFVSWLIAAIFYGEQERSYGDYNPIGAISMLTGVSIGIVLAVKYFPALIWAGMNYYAPYNLVNIGEIFGHFLVLLVASLVLLLFGREILVDPIGDLDYRKWIRKKTRTQNGFKKNHFLVIGGITLSAAILLSLGAPKITHHPWQKEQANVQIDILENGERVYEQHHIRENRTIDVQSRGWADWIGLRYGEADYWQLLFAESNEELMASNTIEAEHKSIEGQDFKNFSTIRLKTTNKDALQNRTLVLERERPVNHSKFNISNFQLRESSGLCRLNFTISSEIDAPKIRLYRTTIDHRNVDELDDYNISTVRVYDVGDSSLDKVGQEVCDSTSSDCLVDTEGGYVWFRTSSRFVDDGTTLIIEELGVENSTFTYLFDITADCN